MAKDYYAILGVQKSATEAEIKQAYRKLSKELHPDKHKGDKGKEAKFKEVNEAYEVLSDTTKRGNYDRFGNADFNGFGGGGGGGGGGFGGYQQGFEGMNFNGDLNDLFSSFFSGASGGGRRPDTRGRNVEVEISIPLSDAVKGAERTITFTTQITCDECAGSGSAPGAKTVTCTECSGAGSVQRTAKSLFGAIRQSVVCPTCSGSGKVPEKPCKKCSGDGRVSGKKTVNVRIPAGIDDGQTMRLTGEGEAGKQGVQSGDLLVHVRVEQDARFERQGDDIRSTLPLSVIDAVLGTEANIETVQGVTKVSIPAGTQPGQVLRLKGKGMPVLNTNRHGDHYVTVDILVPTKLSRDEKRLYEELKKVL
ncbi:MAG: molecular chaperone DnaJ [Candidatus Peribacteraceae bacterium]|nr:molecular chaperone DnaJ [Candidatus Peribacteraceae bacterium]